MRQLLTGLAALGLLLTGTACEDKSEPGAAIGVEAKDFEFVPASLTGKAGKLIFSITNTGSAVHEFEIFKGRTLIDEVEDIAPGVKRILSVTIDAGTYEYACKIDDHYERGMKGTLKVT
jgi:plastocyanin